MSDTSASIAGLLLGVGLGVSSFGAISGDVSDLAARVTLLFAGCFLLVWAISGNVADLLADEARLVSGVFSLLRAVADQVFR